MPTFHERVASKMALSRSAGTLNTYDEILDALHKHFPTEQELRAHVEHLEDIARKSGEVAPDWTFLDDH